MSKRHIVLILLFLFSAGSGMPQALTSGEKLRQIIRDGGQAEVTVLLSEIKSLETLTKNVSILSVSGNEVLISLSKLTVDWFLQQNYDYRIMERITPRGVITAVNAQQVMLWDSYPTHTQYDSIMHNFAVIYPGLCRLDTIGTSVEGKLILALKISDNPAVDKDKPGVFYSSTMHGDETGGFVLMLHLADYLLSNYLTNSRVKRLVDSLDIWINPLANPDGTYARGDTITIPTRYNANGFDLNRNFPDPVTPNTVGQKETSDMIRFLRKHRFVLSANFHAGSEVVNYPWDRWLTRFHADDLWFRSISREYADTAHFYAGPEYMNFLNNGITRGADWYIIYGGRQDFVTYELQGREVTIELDNQYVTPAAQLLLLWQNNWHSLIGYLENALNGIHGKVRNANSGKPVAARIFIDGHDKDSSQVYSDTLTGNFVRMLSPGYWNLTFSASGYKPVIKNNISVIEGRKTELVVDMSPFANSVENNTVNEAVTLYPNPASVSVNALLPDGFTGKINIKIINLTGMLISDLDTEAVTSVPISIDVKFLPAGVYIVLFTDLSTGTKGHGRLVVIK